MRPAGPPQEPVPLRTGAGRALKGVSLGRGGTSPGLARGLVRDAAAGGAPGRAVSGAGGRAPQAIGW